MIKEKTSIAGRIEDKAVFCCYIETIADSAIEKLDVLETDLSRNKLNEEEQQKEFCRLKNLIWTMQELAVQASRELFQIQCEL